MKSILMGDLHLGIRSDDSWIAEYQRKLIVEAINYSNEHCIKSWVFLGDVFDTRKSITHVTMEFCNEIFSLLQANNIKAHVIVGNHDMFFKEKIHPNACTELLSSYDNVVVYDKPTTIDLGGVEFDMIPWMCDENMSDVLTHIKSSNAEYCIGHFELNGFYFYKGLKSHGIEPDFLKNYKQVYSGHFHTISSAANVLYCGTPYTLTAGDENDQRGFWVFDSDTKEHTFVENDHTWHKKIFYPIDNFYLEDYKDVALRVFVDEMDSNFVKFENNLESVVHSLRIISKYDNSSDNNEVIEVKSILDIMIDYINDLTCTDDDKAKLTVLVKQMYMEVTNV